jgi:hypothetical protein
VIEWYLTEAAGDVDSVEELAARRKLVTRVLRRLLQQDNMLIAVQVVEGQGGEAELEEMEASGKGDDDRLLMVNPEVVLPEENVVGQFDA